MVLHAIEGLTSSICQLKSLRVITLSGSKKLMVFPNIVENMEGLRGVYLDRTSTGELPASTERLGLDFNNCKRLVYLPDTTINLATLQWPTLCGCSKLSTLPEDLWYLRHFDVDRTLVYIKTTIKDQRFPPKTAMLQNFGRCGRVPEQCMSIRG